MKRFFMVVLVLVVFLIAFGFYQRWFSLSSPSPAAGSNKFNISLTVDPDKMKADTNTAKEKTGELSSKATAGAK